MNLNIDQNTIYWILSTTAQTYGAILGLSGAFMLFRISRLSDEVKNETKRNENIEDIKEKFIAFLAYHIAIISAAIMMMNFTCFLEKHQYVFLLALFIVVVITIYSTTYLCLTSIGKGWKFLISAVWNTTIMPITCVWGWLRKIFK